MVVVCAATKSVRVFWITIVIIMAASLLRANALVQTKRPKSGGKVRLVWHRRDLRLQDNWLYSNLESDESPVVISLFIFNKLDFQPRPSTCRPNEWDAVNIGPHAARILLDSVQDLRASLRAKGGELIIRKSSNVADVICKLISEQNGSIYEVYWNEEPGMIELQQSKLVKRAIQDRFPDVQIETSMQYTLYHPDDLPNGKMEWQHQLSPNKPKNRRRSTRQQQNTSSVATQIPPSGSKGLERWDGMPKIMGDFRKAARNKTKPRKCKPAPAQLQVPEIISSDSGECPTLEELTNPLVDCKRPILGLSKELVAKIVDNSKNRSREKNQSSFSFSTTGGEKAGLQHLSDFLANHGSTAERNLAETNPNNSAHISHYLAFGCLSPRKIVEEASNCVDSEECRWVISHMTMRDFFLYTCMASGPNFYQLDGIPISKKKKQPVVWKSFEDGNKELEPHWTRWASGNTGLPLVDAAMRELINTGYCSNRVRQNVASVLTKDLGIDWRAGAELFQLLLEDHCVGANWGNWLYFSGVGPDPKQRHFRTVSQALKYDETGSYVMKWLPELKKVMKDNDDETFLRPWDFCEKWKKNMIVNPESQYTWQDMSSLNETGLLRSKALH